MYLLFYCLKVVLCSGILLGYYWLFLRNKKFHHYNRFYLLATLLIPVLLPLASVPIQWQPGAPVHSIIYRVADFTTFNQPVIVKATPGFHFTTRNLTGIFYVAGCAALLFLLLRSLLYIRKLERTYEHTRLQQLKFYMTNEPGTPFSFFRSVFWNRGLDVDSKEGQQILKHELFHVQQKHSADVLLSEIICLFGWFNPFFFLIKKELKAIHEFLADQYAVSGNDKYAYATLLVEHVIQSRQLSITHPFFQNHLKRRVAMITQFNQTKYGYWSRVLALPFLMTVFFAIALKAQQPTAPTHSEQVATASATANYTVSTQTITAKKNEPTTAAPTAAPIVTNATASAIAIDITKVRLLKENATTRDEVTRAFGKASVSTINTEAEVWEYWHNNAQLNLAFDRKSNLLKAFQYNEVLSKSSMLNYNAAQTIERTKTSAADIERLFGQPNNIFINQQEEAWHYGNDNSVLNLSFNRNGIVNDFVFSQHEPGLYADTSKPLSRVDILPAYPGGVNAWKDFLHKNLKYPQQAIDKEIKGTVVLQFVVAADGTLSNVEALTGPQELRSEAMRLIKASGKWNPALVDGKKVNAYLKQPIIFALERS
ncbi:MAG: M56 family metallopeptidase [Chitinophagaceae bacterium]